MDKPSLAEMQKMAKALEAIRDRKKYRAMDFYVPYPQQELFMALSAHKRERLLRAGNQLGKTLCGSMEAAFHLTGEYPDWWMGRRWDRPVKMWASSKTGISARDTVQKYLCGEAGVVEAQGTGSIPRDAVDWKNGVSMSRSAPDAYDTVQVRHKSGGMSILRFKSYDQGREKWQGDTLDIIWCDEEPDMDIYSEALARLTATKGMVYITFTPLKGKSDVVLRYLNEPSEDRAEVVMTIDDALHISPEERAKVVAGYPAHQREARARGEPLLGAGKIFLATEASITEVRIENLPMYWFYLWGLDFGINHPFAAVLMGWDKDADVIHIIHTIRMADAKPIEHVRAMKPWMPGCPVSWPQDGTAREHSGEVVSSLYKKEGLNMLPVHATHAEGGLGTEAGILEMDTRMLTGRFKVAAHLSDFFGEYRDYHRGEDGLIVKKRDDIMSATRIGVMMRRKARRLSDFGEAWANRNTKQGAIADGVDSGSHFGA